MSSNSTSLDKKQPTWQRSRTSRAFGEGAVSTCTEFAGFRNDSCCKHRDSQVHPIYKGCGHWDDILFIRCPAERGGRFWGVAFETFSPPSAAITIAAAGRRRPPPPPIPPHTRPAAPPMHISILPATLATATSVPRQLVQQE